ncbi:MAG: hypothetical protein RID23_09615 [Roseovarius sp.]
MTDTPERPSLDFKSKEEFRSVCHRLAMRMHYLNRVAMGEQKFSWEVADLLSRLGRVFDEHYGDPEIHKAFGDGWEKGVLNDEERRAYLYGLLYDKD